MSLGGVATAALPSVVRLQMVFSDRLGGLTEYCGDLHTKVCVT